MFVLLLALAFIDANLFRGSIAQWERNINALGLHAIVDGFVGPTSCLWVVEFQLRVSFSTKAGNVLYFQKETLL